MMPYMHEMIYVYSSNVRPSCFFRVPKGNKHAQGYPRDPRGGRVWIEVNWRNRSWVRVYRVNSRNGVQQKASGLDGEQYCNMYHTFSL